MSIVGQSINQFLGATYECDPYHPFIHLHGTSQELGVALVPGTEAETQVVLHPLTYLFYLNELVQEGTSIIHPLNMRNIECWSNGTLIHQILAKRLIIALEITSNGMEIHVHRDVSLTRIDEDYKLILKFQEVAQEIGVVADIHQFSYIPFPPLSPTTFLTDYGAIFKKFVKQSQRNYLQSKCKIDVFPDQEEENKTSSSSSEGIQEGRYEDATGVTFEGTLDLKSRHLIKGRITRPDGDWFEGEWQGLHFFGKGKLTLPSGETFEGDFFKGKFVNGINRRMNEDVLTGQFKKMIFSGEGRVTWNFGYTEQGTFLNGTLTNGKKDWSDGDWLEGTFTKEGFSGNGRYTARSGIIAEGTFENWKLIQGRKFRAGDPPPDAINQPLDDTPANSGPPVIRITILPQRRKRSTCCTIN